MAPIHKAILTTMALFVGSLLLVGGIVAGLSFIPKSTQPQEQHAPDVVVDQGDEDPSIRAARQEAMARAVELADDQTKARKSGLSLASYKRAKAHAIDAYAACVAAIKEAARYEVKTNWLPDFEWSSDGETITIIGHDMHLQNGFGAISNEPYTCEWDMKSGKITNVGG